MAPSSKSEKDDSKQKAQRKHKDHVVKLLMRGKVGMHLENGTKYEEGVFRHNARLLQWKPPCLQ